MASDGRNWTSSAAKWVVVAILGGASFGGIAWTIRTRLPRASSAPSSPIAAEQIEIEPSVSRGDPGSGEERTSSRDSSESNAAETDPSARPAADESASAPRLININTASAAELELLPQIGPTLASRIVAEREANGPFASLEDIERVRGIGPRTIEKIKELAMAR